MVEMRLALQAHLEMRDPNVWKFSDRGREAVRGDIKSRFAKNNCFMVVAEAEEKIPIGIMLAEVVTDIHREPERFGHIHWLYILEGARRVGLGREFVRFACRFFSVWEVGEVTIGYVVKNTEAEAFWNALGFQPRVLHSGTGLSDLENLL